MSVRGEMQNGRLQPSLLQAVSATEVLRDRHAQRVYTHGGGEDAQEDAH